MVLTEVFIVPNFCLTFRSVSDHISVHRERTSFLVKMLISIECLLKCVHRLWVSQLWGLGKSVRNSFSQHSELVFRDQTTSSSVPFGSIRLDDGHSGVSPRFVDVELGDGRKPVVQNVLVFLGLSAVSIDVNSSVISPGLDLPLFSDGRLVLAWLLFFLFRGISTHWYLFKL